MSRPVAVGSRGLQTNRTERENERDRERSAHTGPENEWDWEQLVETGRDKRTERERRKKITVPSWAVAGRLFPSNNLSFSLGTLAPLAVCQY